MNNPKRSGRDVSAKQEREGWGPVTEAALALERELRRFEQLTTTARKVSIDTRKGIERAAQATTEAAQGQERVNATLSALVQAITAARQRHEANAAALQARGEEIRLRAEQMEPLYARYAALGDESRAIHALVQEAAVLQRAATTPEGVHQTVAAIQDIEDRMSNIADSAREVGAAAAQVSLTDLVEQSDALRQQVTAARNKLGLLKKGLLAQLPEPSKLN